MPSKSNPIGVKTVECPQCGGISVYASGNPYRPFCGDRCKNLDLGAWASEQFKLPEKASNSDPEFEQS
jgi:endogenous inhibitor of DNA gyrase (YacG/DUF329 family)